MTRFDRKISIARALYLGSRTNATSEKHATAPNAVRAYDLALLAELEGGGDAVTDPSVERAEMWRRRLGAAVLVLLICGLAILAGISGPEPVHPSLLAAP